MRVAEVRVAPERLRVGLAALEHRAQLATARDAEVESRPDPLGRQRQAVAGGVADEEDAVLGRRAQLVRDPVPLEADRLGAEVLRQLHGVVLHVEARVERADADPQLVARGEAPPVAGGHDRAVDPDRQVVGASVRMHLQPARERRVRRLVAAVPASMRRQPSASTISGALRSPRSVCTVSPVRPFTFAVSNSQSPWARSSRHSSG